MRYWQFGSMVIMTILVLVLINRPSVDCNDPVTWSTAEGVEQCAINGGK